MSHLLSLLVLFPLALLAACSQPQPGVVSAAAPAAAEAGWDMLLAGGNAADAAVAAAFTLGVAEPAGSGIGGQSVVLLMRRGETPVVLDGSSFAPRNLPAAVIAGSVHAPGVRTPGTARHHDVTETGQAANGDPLAGRRGTTVPTTVRTLHTLWRDYGSGRLSWEDVLAPAIRAAEEGVRFGPFARAALLSSREQLLKDSLARTNFLPGGSILAAQQRVRQPQLARTLRRIANDPESFYSGAIADEIAADMRRHDGWVTAEDLASVRDPLIRRPLHVRYRGKDVYSVPPPYGGWVVLQALALLDAPLAEGDAGGRDALIEALTAAHRSRRDHPVQALRGEDTTAAGQLSAERIRALRAEMPGSGETTHLSVADGKGMVVGISQSVNYYFGAKVMHPTLGFFYNDYMREFVRDERDHPYALKPGALPYSSMSPTVVAEDGAPQLMLGSPGSARIISAVVQVIRAAVGEGASLRDAVARPRLHVIPDSAVFFEDADERNAWLRREGRPAGTADAPSDVLIRGRNPWFGGVHAVMRSDQGWTGVADPRRDGAVRPLSRSAR